MPTPDGHPDGDDDAATRRRARLARQSIGADDRSAAEERICRSVVSLQELSRAARVGWYLGTDGEVDLGPAVGPLRSRGTELWLPVIGPSRSMRFAAWTPATPLVPNRYGIAEPVCSPDDMVSAAELDAVLVPSVAVDPDGHRLGFGAQADG